MTTAYEPVIGLEIHVQLNTRTKMFCGCELSFGEPPNTRTCEVCLGLPGALPVVNETMVRTGLLDWAEVADRMSSVPARIGRVAGHGRPIEVGEAVAGDA